MHLNTQLMPAADPFLPYSCSWERQHETPFHAHLGLILSRHILVFVIQLNECCTILNLNYLPRRLDFAYSRFTLCRYNDVLADTFIPSTLGVWTCDFSVANTCYTVYWTFGCLCMWWIVSFYFVIGPFICSSFLRVDLGTGSKQLVTTQNSLF